MTRTYQPLQMIGTQTQSQAVHSEEISDSYQTDNQLAQRSLSVTSDDFLLGDQIYDKGRDNSISEDLLELNTEEQEQFEVLDSADSKSHGKVHLDGY